MEMIDRFVLWFFVVPTPPKIEQGVFGRVTGGLASALGDFAKLAYWTGVKDGLVVGILGTLVALVLVLVAALIFRQGSVTKGVINAVNSIL